MIQRNRQAWHSRSGAFIRVLTVLLLSFFCAPLHADTEMLDAAIYRSQTMPPAISVGGVRHLLAPEVKADSVPPSDAALRSVAAFAVAIVIHAECPGYERLSAVKERIDSVSMELGHQVVQQLVTKAVNEVSARYRLTEDAKGFCARILEDHGPESDFPVVSRAP